MLRLSWIQPLIVIVLAGIATDAMMQVATDPFNVWLELGKYGAGGLLAGLFAYWKRTDDKVYIKALEKHLSDANEREDKLLEIVREDVRAITSTAATLEQYMNATQIVAEIREMRRESQDGAHRPRPRSGA